jgi:neutral ceramidase
MQTAKFVVCLVGYVLLCVAMVACGPVKAGVAKVDGTLPVGTPLAGFNHGARRVPHWPLPHVTDFTTFMTGSTGALNPTWTKALILDDGETRVALCTFDGIGADGSLSNMARDIAEDMGMVTPRENVIFSGSHSHSGPGAVSPELLWALAPATDFLVPELQIALATSMATAIIEAEKNMVDAEIGISIGQLANATVNRRAKISPYLKTDSIDPNVGVIRVDKADGTVLATLWNFAIHGVCYGPDNMQFSSDIMGGVCDTIEAAVGGVALFVNADAGDIDPAPGVCDNKPNFAGAPYMAKVILETRAKAPVSKTLEMATFSTVVPFGNTDMNITLSRFNNCTSGGPLDICTICEFLRCDENAHLPDNYVEQNPIFNAIKFTIDNVTTGLVTMPGEALMNLGDWIREDLAAMHFDQALLFGYSNSHMGYFATPREYDIGGYESQLTFWGIGTAEKVRESCKMVASKVASA